MADLNVPPPALSQGRPTVEGLPADETPPNAKPAPLAARTQIDLLLTQAKYGSDDCKIQMSTGQEYTAEEFDTLTHRTNGPRSIELGTKHSVDRELKEWIERNENPEFIANCFADIMKKWIANLPTNWRFEYQPLKDATPQWCWLLENYLPDAPRPVIARILCFLQHGLSQPAYLGVKANSPPKVEIFPAIQRFQLWLAVMKKIIRGAIHRCDPIRWNSLYPIEKKDSRVKIREITNCAYAMSKAFGIEVENDFWEMGDISLNYGTPDIFRRTYLPRIDSFEKILRFFPGYYFWVVDFMECYCTYTVSTSLKTSSLLLTFKNIFLKRRLSL